MDKHSKLMELLHATNASFGEPTIAGSVHLDLKAPEIPAATVTASASGSAFMFPRTHMTAIVQRLQRLPAGKNDTPEASISEETVGCQPKGLHVLLHDAPFEESVCSAEDEDDAPPVKKPRTGMAMASSEDGTVEEVQSPFVPCGAFTNGPFRNTSLTVGRDSTELGSASFHTAASTYSGCLDTLQAMRGIHDLAPRPGTPRPLDLLPQRIPRIASPAVGGGGHAAFAAGFNMEATAGGMMHVGANQLPLQGAVTSPLPCFETPDGSEQQQQQQTSRIRRFNGQHPAFMTTPPSSRQANDGGLLAVLPLLTPIGCDLEPSTLGDGASDDKDDSEASEDRQCADRLSAMKLLARGKGAATPTPAFWAAIQDRSHEEEVGFVYHMEPLPDDLEREE